MAALGANPVDCFTPLALANTVSEMYVKIATSTRIRMHVYVCVCVRVCKYIQLAAYDGTQQLDRY